ncbi:MAG: MAPEG family protein [Pseudomonadota bacterium]
MVEIIAAVLLFFVIQTVIPPAIQYFGGDKPLAARMLVALGPRDNPPPMPTLAKRADKALKNFMESLPIFITLALMSLILGKANGLALTGAMTFLIARVAYVPAYLSGIPGLRSIVWGIGTGGLVAMLVHILE